MSKVNKPVHPVYQQIKNHYDRTTPIRGKRAGENIRPAGDRSRTNERVVLVQRGDGDWYGYRLYNTDVVLVSEAGVIEFNTDGWVTRSTTDFMGWVGHVALGYLFYASRQDNKIWIVGRQKPYPLLENTTQFQITEYRQLTPLQPLVEQIPVVDRKKMREAMLPFMPMVEYLKAFHTLTQGNITKQTIEEQSVKDGWRVEFVFSTGDKFSSGLELRYHYDALYRVATEGTTDDWTKFYCWMVAKYGGRRDSEKYFDEVKPAGIRNRIAEVVKKEVDVWAYKPKDWAADL